MDDLRREQAEMLLERAALLKFSKDTAHQHLRDALKAGAEALARSWQPIETAPKDGTEVLLLVKRRAGIPGKMLVGHYMRGGHCIEDHPAIDPGWYFWNGRMFDAAAEPLSWMPLPSIASETAK